MKKLFIFLFFSFCFVSSFATNYYFATAGSDGNAGDSAHPWQTITKFNTVFSSKLPGDKFLFNRGDVFYGSLNISRSGAVGNPITIGAYGTGANPIITGFVSVVAWTNRGGNIWESTFAISSMNDMNMVVINGVNIPMGRSPNTGWWTVKSHQVLNLTTAGNFIIGTAYQIVSVGTTNFVSIGASSNTVGVIFTANGTGSGTGTANSIGKGTRATITSDSLTSSWSGADFYMKNFYFSGSRNTVTSQTGTQISYVTTTQDNPSDGFGFFIENDPRTLDAINEWYYNPSTGKVQVYNTVTPTNVQVTTLDTLVYMVSRNYIKFDGLDFTGSNKRTFFIQSSSEITIQNCNLNFNGLYGIWGGSNGASNSDSLNFNHNTINHTNHISLYLANQFKHAYIGYNTIKNNGVHGAEKDLINRYPNFANAVQLSGSGTNGVDNVTIEYNFLDSTGFNGINWYGNSTTIRYNEVSHYCSLLQDGGGIYTWHGPTNPPSTNCKIYNNLCHDGFTAYDGTPNQNGPQTSGFYADENTGNTQYTNNSAWNNPLAGLFSNSDTACNFTGNTFYNNSFAGAYISGTFHPQKTYATAGTLEAAKSDTILNNIFFAKLSSQLTVYYHFLTKADLLAGFNVLDSNYYARPIDDFAANLSIQVHDPGDTLKTLITWKSLVSPKDVNAHKSPLSIVSTTNDLDFEYNATASPVTINLPGAGNYIDARGTIYTGTITLQPYTTAVLIKNTTVGPVYFRTRDYYK